MFDRKSLLLFLCFLVALLATSGSLFFSDYMKFYPCVMCWYQRVFMYPLLPMFLIAFVKQDAAVLRYSFPLNGLGLGFSIYHLLLYFEVIPETLAPCVEGVSCTVTYIQWFGFITIPMLSFCAFSLLLVFQLFLRRFR